MYAVNVLPQRSTPQLTFNDFLATHGVEGIKRVVDVYDSTKARGADAVKLLNENASIFGVTSFNDKLLSDIFNYANSKVGRVSGNIKDNPFENSGTNRTKLNLETEVRRGYSPASVTPISSARNYGVAKEHSYEEPAKVIPLTRATGTANKTPYNAGNTARRRNSLSLRTIGKVAVASELAAYLTLNPFSGLFGERIKNYLGDVNVKAAYAQTSVAERKARTDAILKHVQDTLKKGQAPIQLYQNLLAKLDSGDSISAELAKKYDSMQYGALRTQVADVRKHYDTNKASFDDDQKKEAEGRLTALEDAIRTYAARATAKVPKKPAVPAKVGAPTPAVQQYSEELSKLHAAYRKAWQQRGPWHEKFMKGELKYKDLPPEGQKWFGLQKAITTIQERQDDCIVTVKIPHSYKGADLPQQYMGVKLPGKGWVFALPPNQETNLTFSKQGCDVFKASREPVLQWGMYAPNDGKKERFLVSSVNKEKVIVSARPAPSAPSPPPAPATLEGTIDRVLAEKLKPFVGLPDQIKEMKEKLGQLQRDYGELKTKIGDLQRVPPPAPRVEPSADIPGRIPYRVWHSTESAQGRREDPRGTETELSISKPQRPDVKKPLQHFNIFEYYERTIEQAP